MGNRMFSLSVSSLERLSKFLEANKAGVKAKIRYSPVKSGNVVRSYLQLDPISSAPGLLTQIIPIEVEETCPKK